MKRIILFLLISVNYLYAGNTKITMHSGEKEYSLDETIDVVIKLESDKSLQINKFPRTKNLKLTGTPSHSTSYNYQNFNGVAKTNVIVTYRLTYMPIKKGPAKIHPVKIKKQGKLYISNGLSFNISESIEDDIDSKENFDFKFDQDVFIAARVSKANVYVGEEVIVSYDLYRRLKVDFAEQPVIPSFKNFWLEELDNENYGRAKKKIYKGFYFEVIPLSKMAVFPIKSGELIIPPYKAKFKANIFSFGASPNKIYRRTSNLVKLNVKELPEKEKPKDFPQGNVGDYTFTVSISKNKVKVNEPFTINMSVKGRGNIKNVVLPKIENIDGFKVYEPTETITTSNRKTIRGVKSVSIAVKAEKPGTFRPFKFNFKYFNPKTKRYYDIDYSKLKVIVEGEVNSNNNDLKNTINNNDSDNIHKISVSLKPISTSTNLIKGKNYTFLYILLILLIFSLPLLYIIISYTLFRKYKHISNKDVLTMKNSYKKAMASLKILEKGDFSSREFFSQLHNIIIVYIEEKFSIVAKGLTINQISIFLEEKAVKEVYIKVMTDILENSEYIKYSSAETSIEDQKHSLTQIKNILNNINRGE